MVVVGLADALSLTFAKFLELLRSRGRASRADEIEKLAVRRLCPPLTKAHIMEATVEAVAISAEIVSLLSVSYTISGTVESRIAELEGEGFSMLKGVGKNAG